LDSGGKAHVIRFDDNGITILSHGNLQIFANQSLTLSAGQNITIDCENLTVQQRLVLKNSGGSI
jgi:phage-related protein